MDDDFGLRFYMEVGLRLKGPLFGLVFLKYKPINEVYLSLIRSFEKS